MDSKTIVIGLVVGLLLGGGGIYAVTSQQQSSLQSQVASLNTEADMVPELQQTISTLTDEKTSLQSQFTSLQEEVAEVSTLQQTVETLSDEKTALETTVTTLNTQLEVLTATVSQLQNTSQEQETTIEDLQALNLELMNKIPTYPSGWTRVVTASGQGLDTWGSELFYVPNEQIRITWQCESTWNYVDLYKNGVPYHIEDWLLQDGMVAYVNSLTADRYYVTFDPEATYFPPAAKWTLTVDVWAP